MEEEEKKKGKSKMFESQKKNKHDLALRSDFSVSLGADKQVRFMKKYIQQAVDSFKEHHNIKESDVGILGMLDETEKLESTKEGKRLMDFYSKQGEIESKMNKLISQLGDLERDAVRLANEL